MRLGLVALGLGLSGMAGGAITFTNGSFDASGTTTGAFFGTANITTGLGGWTLAGKPGSAQIDCVVPAGANGQVCNGNAPSTFDTTATSAHPANVFYFSLYAYPGASPDGGNYFLGDGDASFSSALSQTVTGLVSGHSYQVSFYQAAGEENCLADDGPPGCPPPGGNITGQWKVTFGATTLNSALMTTPVNTANPGSILTPWNLQKLVFQATSASQVISFLAAGTPSGAPPLVFLDGISIAEVPEPGTVALIGLGLLMVTVGRRMGKRA
jgi:PEP-CTERM motif